MYIKYNTKYMSIQQLQKCGKHTTLLHAAVNTRRKYIYSFAYKYAA